MRSSVLGVALLALVVPSAAHAQATSGTQAGGRIFVSVNALGQGGDGELIDQTESWTVYGETATQQALQQVSMSGVVLDFGGGFRTNRFGLGVAFSASKDTNTGVVASSIPHPFLFDRPRTSLTDVDGLEHKERVLHLQAYYFIPIEEKAELGRSSGHPSSASTRITSQAWVPSRNRRTSRQSPSRPAAPPHPIRRSGSTWVPKRPTGSHRRSVPRSSGRFIRASPEFDFGGQPMTMNVGETCSSAPVSGCGSDGLPAAFNWLRRRDTAANIHDRNTPSAFLRRLGLLDAPSCVADPPSVAHDSGGPDPGDPRAATHARPARGARPHCRSCATWALSSGCRWWNEKDL